MSTTDTRPFARTKSTVNVRTYEDARTNKVNDVHSRVGARHGQHTRRTRVTLAVGGPSTKVSRLPSILRSRYPIYIHIGVPPIRRHPFDMYKWVRSIRTDPIHIFWGNVRIERYPIHTGVPLRAIQDQIRFDFESDRVLIATNGSHLNYFLTTWPKSPLRAVDATWPDLGLASP